MNITNSIEVGKMDELGRSDSPIHRLDARVKILTTVAFILTVMSFGRYDISQLMVLFIYPFALMAVGNIPVGFIFKKVAIAAPFAVCVGMFNPFLDREILAVIGGHPIAAGWFSFGSILVRFALTVSAGLILIAGTGIYRLCEGLQRLGIPKVFAVQLLFLYRYFFVIAEEGLRMLKAVEVRSAGNHRLGLATYGSLVGHLLLRSMDRAQRIYRAMVSRGFEGEVRVGRRTGTGEGRWINVAYLVGWCLFFLLARYWNIAGAVGSHL